jgi:hypothetical protein
MTGFRYANKADISARSFKCYVTDRNSTGFVVKQLIFWRFIRYDFEV